MIVLHTPFHNLPELMMLRLLGHVMGLGAEEGKEFLRGRGLYASAAPVARIGNTYTASLYLCLAALLEDRFRREGEKIVGRSVLMASYGSGNTMVVVRGRVVPGAPEVIRRWPMERLLECSGEAGWEEYLRWAEGPEQRNGSGVAESLNSHPGSHFLRRIRADGYREYGYRELDYQSSGRRADSQAQKTQEPSRSV
jgi:hydroxymethylglutaryl-CoA synthase